MDKNKEVWMDIPEYKGYYQASNLGRVRSLDRWVTYSNGRKCFYKGGIIKGTISDKGYNQTTLRKNNIGRTFKFSQLVAMAFLRHEPMGHKIVVDHINGNRLDDKLENLRIVTFRENVSTCFRAGESRFSSRYVGVHWSKVSSKWISQIRYGKNRFHLGSFDCEREASNAYQEALLKIKNGSFITDKIERS